MKNSNSSSPGKIHWLSVWQFGLSVLAILNLWSSAFGLMVFSVSNWLSDLNQIAEPLGLLMLAAGMFTGGLLLLPSAGYALWHLLGREVKNPRPVLHGLRPTLLIFALPILLLLGYWVIGYPALSWLVIPVLHVLAIGIPVLWVLYLGVRDLPLGSPQRRWGVFGSGLVLGPVTVLIFEALALLGFAGAGVIWLAGQPELVKDLTDLAQWLTMVEPTPELLLDRLSPYVTQPAVIFAVLAFGALVVPLVEEALKPIGVWLLVGRDLSPGEGFAAGVLSGAGFALFESLSITIGAEDWVMLVVVRIGTAVIHIFTAGLMGWALTLAWGENRYLRLAFTYLGVVALHGLWNGLTLLNAFSTIAEEIGAETGNVPLPNLADVAPYILGALSVLALAAILAVNRHLARRQNTPIPPNDRLVSAIIRRIGV